MKHSIDPLVDCVFKALLGSEANKNLLVHFLNAVMNLDEPIVDVELLNPFNERRYEGDKLTIVDVKARTASGMHCQVEVQRRRDAYLPQRIRYTWAELTLQSIGKGVTFKSLRPTVSIWVMGEALGSSKHVYHHRVFLNDPETGLTLDGASTIHILDLPHVPGEGDVEDDLQRWLRFLKEAPTFREGNLPSYMKTQEMQQAMSTLKGFSEQEREYDLYSRRRIYEMVQQERREEKEELEQGLAATKASLDAAQAEMIKVEAEKAQVEAEKAQVEAEKAQVEAEKAQVEAEKAQVEAERAQVEAEKAQVEAEMAQIEAEKVAALRAHWEELEAIKAKNQRLEEEVQSWQARFETLEGAIEARLSSLEKGITKA